MAITGHKTKKAFYSYIKVSEEEHAEMLKNIGQKLTLKANYRWRL